MSLNAVQLYLKGILNGLALPSDLGTLTAFITPPSPDYVSDPVIYIWGSTQVETRQTMPRAKPGQPATGGFKRIQHEVDAWLIWFGQADDTTADSQFPMVIDAVNAAVRNVLMPVSLTDPTTGAPYTILAVGEHIRTDYAPVHQVEDQRWYCYNARHIFSITELIQA